MDALAIGLLVLAAIGIALSFISLSRRMPAARAGKLRIAAALLVLVGLVGFWVVFWSSF